MQNKYERDLFYQPPPSLWWKIKDRFFREWYRHSPKTMLKWNCRVFTEYALADILQAELSKEIDNKILEDLRRYLHDSANHVVER